MGLTQTFGEEVAQGGRSRTGEGEGHATVKTGGSGLAVRAPVWGRLGQMGLSGKGQAILMGSHHPLAARLKAAAGCSVRKLRAIWSGFLSSHQGAGPSVISKLLASWMKSPCPGLVLTPPHAVPPPEPGLCTRKGQGGPPVLRLEKRLSLVPQYQPASDAVGREGEKWNWSRGEGRVQAQEAWRLRTQL